MTDEQREILWSTGVDVRVDSLPDRLDAAIAFAVASRTHLWIATMVHRAPAGILDALDGKTTEPGHLDVESLLAMPMYGCYVCEQPYVPRLRLRKCPGDPTP